MAIYMPNDPLVGPNFPLAGSEPGGGETIRNQNRRHIVNPLATTLRKQRLITALVLFGLSLSSLAFGPT